MLELNSKRSIENLHYQQQRKQSKLIDYRLLNSWVEKSKKSY